MGVEGIRAPLFFADPNEKLEKVFIPGSSRQVSFLKIRIHLMENFFPPRSRLGEASRLSRERGQLVEVSRKDPDCGISEKYH